MANEKIKNAIKQAELQRMELIKKREQEEAEAAANKTPEEIEAEKAEMAKRQQEVWNKMRRRDPKGTVPEGDNVVAHTPGTPPPAAPSPVSAKEEKVEEREEEKAERERERAKRRREHKDELAKEEPFVLESSEYDPEFPAMEEFEVDEGGAPGTHDPKSGIIWGLIASIAVIILVIVFISIGDWGGI